MDKKPRQKRSLRQIAEQVVAEKGKELSQPSGDETSLAHELEVHQIELEIQNEELRDAQQQLSRSNEELRHARDRYIDLYDYAPVAYFTVNLSSNRILEANLTATDLLKTSRSDICKSRFARFIEPEFADVFHVCGRKALQEPYKQTCEIKMRRSDGPAFWALLEIRGAPQSKQVRIAVADITDRKEMEQIKDDFIGMVSHELRTPLTVIMGSTRVAQSEGISAADRQGLLQEAVRGSENLSHIIDNLIELSRHQSDQLRPTKERTDIEEFIRETMRLEVSHLDEHSVSLNIAGELPQVEVDRIRLRQILRNLLDNAAKYSPANTQIRISAREESGHILIGVSDRGKGISVPDQARLFEPFQRLQEKPGTTPGLGLGLLVCKRLVEAHGGRIWVESHPASGSTFWFTLPLPA